MQLEGSMCSKDYEDEFAASCQTKESQLEIPISIDYKQEFVSFLRNQPHTFSQTQLFNLVCSHRAIGCATALLDGQTGLSVDLNVPLEDSLTPLAVAAKNLCYGLTELFLKHGAEASLSGNVTTKDLSMLPLNLALDALCNHELMRDFARDKSVYKLFSTFWLQDLKEPLDTIKLLASRTKQVDRVGVCCVEECNLVKLAALMLVAWDKLVIDHDICSSPIGMLIRVHLVLESDTGKRGIMRSMWLALVLLKRSDNLVEEYRTTSRVKHEVVPLEVAYQFLTDVKLHEEQQHVFSADLDRLAAQLPVGDKVLLETALAVKMCSKLMINERIYFISKSPEEQSRQNSFYSHIECAMRLDDRDEFVKLVNGVGSIHPSYSKNQVIETVRTFMFAFDSANCAAAILAGETDDIFNFSDLTDVGWSFLHKAAELANPKLTALLLENGFLADERRDCDELNLQAALPLNAALENIRAHYLFRGWKDNKSAINLVVLLCDNEFRNTLETLRLLVEKTTNVYFEFSRYLKEAKMVELGALLMVGCKDFLPSSFVVHNFLSKALTHNARVAGPVRLFSTSSVHWKLHEENDPVERKETLSLIDIFKKIGDYLGAYVRLEQNKRCDQIYSEIAWLIVRAGISDMPVSKFNDDSSRELYLTDHGSVLGREYHNIVEHRSDHKLLPMSMFPKQAAPRQFSNQGAASMMFSRSLHTSALKVDAELIPFIPAKSLIDVLQRLHSPMHCLSIVAGLKRRLRRM